MSESNIENNTLNTQDASEDQIQSTENLQSLVYSEQIEQASQDEILLASADVVDNTISSDVFINSDDTDEDSAEEDDEEKDDEEASQEVQETHSAPAASEQLATQSATADVAAPVNADSNDSAGEGDVEADSGFLGMSGSTWLWGLAGVGAAVALTGSDTPKPDAPTVTLNTDTGVSNDGLTNTATFTVSGLVNKATWEYSSDGGSTWNPGSGDSFTITGEGSYSVVVRQEKGKVSDNSSTVNVTIDTTEPDANSIAVDTTAMTITIGFDEAVHSSHAPSASELAVEQNGSVLEITATAIVDGNLVITVAAFGSGPIQVAYTGSSLQDTAGNDVGAFQQIVVSDGYISGAQVYLDANGDGIAQASELLEGVTTDDMGQVFIGGEAATGDLIIMGGVNTDTGAVNTLILSAPSGYTTINPLTTLVQAVLANSETTVAEAESLVLGALGISLPEGESLSSYDPQQDTSATGLDVQKAVAQVATILSAAVSSAAEGGEEAAQSLVTGNIATAIVNSAGEPINADEATISGYFKDASGTSIVTTETLTLVNQTVATIDQAATLEEVITSQAKATDTVAPVGAESIDLASASDSGAADNLTSDSTPTINVVLGTSDTLGETIVSGDTVALYSGTTMVGSHVLTDADIAAGTASVTPSSALADGVASLTVKIVDRAGNMSAASAIETVTVDTTGPAFTSTNPADINENVAIGTVVYTAAVTDANKSEGITYSLKAGSDAALTIDAATGKVSLLASPDHETATSHNFTVIATDDAGNSTEKALTLNIIDLDDSAPTITSGATAAGIDENSGAGQVIYTATATDDGDISGGVTYSLKAGASADLSIDSQSGAVTLSANPDQDSVPSYMFTVVVKDAAGNMTEKEVSLTIGDLDDTAPTFTSTAKPTVDENTAAGKAIYTAVADDSADVSNGVKYSLKAGSDAALAIDASSGVVTADAKLDFETQKAYAFTVVATDAAGNVTEQAVSLSVNDVNEAPTKVGTLSDVTAVTGLTTTVDVTGAFTDIDDSDTLTFSLVSGELPAGLSLTAAGVISGTATAESSQAAYTIRATDSGGLYVDQTINLKSVSAPVVDSITVTDSTGVVSSGVSGEVITVVLTMSEAFTLDTTAGSPTIGVKFGDTAAVTGTYVSTSGNTLTFSVTAPAGNATSVSLSSIALNGATLVGSTSSQPWETTSVGQTDDYLLDNAGPVFTSGTTGNIHEYWPVGETVYTAMSTDASAVTYSVTGASSIVSINASTGVVTLTDMPEAGSLGFTVVATDALGNSSQQLVQYTVDAAVDVSGPGVMAQGGLNVNLVDNGDGSYTLELFVDDAYQADFADGIGSMDLTFNYTPADFEAISASDVTSAFAFPLVNTGTAGTLVIGGFDLTPYAADSADPVFSIVLTPTQTEKVEVSFTGVIFDTTDMPDTSIVYGDPTIVTGDAGSDAYVLTAGESEITTGDGMDVLVATQNTGDMFHITDFSIGNDSIEFGHLLQDLGYTATATSGSAADGVAQQVVSIATDIAALISSDDSSLDNLFGAYADAENGTVIGFYDADTTSGGVNIETFEVNIGAAATDFSLDDISGFIA